MTNMASADMPSPDRKKAAYKQTRTADRLRLAATPTFAAMAVLTFMSGGGQMPMICSASQGAALLTGMVPMYVLMSVFHATPWLKRIAGRRFPKNAALYGADMTNLKG
jgi:hypothetical protein